jgi:hypothetical protein
MHKFVGKLKTRDSLGDLGVGVNAAKWILMTCVEMFLEDAGVERRMILKLICRKWDGMAWTGLIWLRIGIGGGHL